jgi:hypothetical protein
MIVVKFKYLCLLGCCIVLTIKVYGQKKINVDTLLKFQIENIEAEESINKHFKRPNSNSLLSRKEELIKKYKNKFKKSISYHHRIAENGTSTFYFTSAVPNDPIYTSQISALGYSHQVKRGINILIREHGQFIVLNYDLYEDASLMTTFIARLKELCVQKLFFALVVDRNFEILPALDKQTIRDLGFIQLADLTNGEAYVGYLHRGFIKETTSTSSLSITYSDEISKIIQPQRDIDSNAVDANRFIAHAGGTIEGHTYTNTLNALDSSYYKGFKLYELDICETIDSHFVATHDWDTWALQTGFQGSLPPTLAEYNSLKIFGKYAPIDMDHINLWFKNHPDAILVSDKVNEPSKFASQFVDTSRLIMELFTLDAVKEGLTTGIKSAMPSEVVIGEINGDLNLLIQLGVKNIALSRWSIIDDNALFLNGLKANNINAYIYLVFDEAIEVTNNMYYVFGIYADNWKYFKK